MQLCHRSFPQSRVNSLLKHLQIRGHSRLPVPSLLLTWTMTLDEPVTKCVSHKLGCCFAVALTCKFRIVQASSERKQPALSDGGTWACRFQRFLAVGQKPDPAKLTSQMESMLIFRREKAGFPAQGSPRPFQRMFLQVTQTCDACGAVTAARPGIDGVLGLPNGFL